MPAATTDRSSSASISADGRLVAFTSDAYNLGSLNAALSADGQVVAFESEGRWWLRMAASPWDVFVHDEQP
jgi:anti-sigma factor RsiW